MDKRASIGIDLPPMAPVLMQSLRAVGYTTPAAVADLVDNSIAAKARKVAIRFTAAPEPFVAVIDDGEGMEESTLYAAMRFGSRDPRLPSTGIDLGRFGLGLKTASLSQCRNVTVASYCDGDVAIACWDLDECERRGTWWLGTPGVSTVPGDVLEVLRANGRGTAVVWQNLDRLAAFDTRRALDVVMEDVADHLAMVFHRFLTGEIVGAFDITVNDRPLPRLDPFLEGHARGQALHGESFMVEGHAVSVSPFVLPFPSRLKPGELDRAGGRESLKTGHGFYVYRGGRLVVPGGWFRIVPSDELIRLARVRVDVPVVGESRDVLTCLPGSAPSTSGWLRRIARIVQGGGAGCGLKARTDLTAFFSRGFILETARQRSTPRRAHVIGIAQPCSHADDIPQPPG